MMSHESLTPSAWVVRWAELVPAGGRVLDVAAGSGRHSKWFAARGHPVDAVDRDEAAVTGLSAMSGVRALCADIEAGDWPFQPGAYAAVCVTNYLHRPLLPTLLDALAPAGVFIYETFAAGNERYGRPKNPDFLLDPGELLELVRGRLKVIAYEDVTTQDPRPACVQRICAAAIRIAALGVQSPD
jgi:SAM-dependent methyltransferase